jgi:5'-3' exonuclease
MTKLLVYDMSTVLYRAFFVHSQETNMDLLVRLAYNTGFNLMYKYYRIYRPDRMVCVFDRPNWRVDYSKSEQSYSKVIYKGHRRQSMTPEQLKVYKIFKMFMADFEEVLTECTGITVLAADKLEADDIIAGVCHRYGGEDTASNNRFNIRDRVDDHFVTVLSTDKDMIQLLRYKNVEVIDIATGKNRTMENCGFDSVDYYLYEKSMKGDPGDNVPNAYPRYRKTKIREAFEDPYKHTNLMSAEWVNYDERIMSVGEMYKENRVLVDLTHQPDDIQDLILDTVVSGFSHRRTFSLYHYLTFVGTYELKRLSDYLDAYTPMLS